MNTGKILTFVGVSVMLCLVMGVGMSSAAAADGSFNKTVGVVDDADEYGSYVETFLEGPNGLPDHYDVSVVDSSHPTTNQHFDVYVVQHLDQDHRSQFVEITNHSDIGVVYLDQRRDSNGIEALSADTNDPSVTMDSSEGADVKYFTLADHPILNAWATTSNATIHTGYGTRTWFSGTDADVIATISNDSGSMDGPGLAVDDNRSLVLASGLGVSAGTAAYFTADAKVLLSNAVRYVTQEPTIGVVDDAGAHGDAVVAALENTSAVPDSVTIERVTGTHPNDEDPHDAYVVQHLSDTNRTQFVTATGNLDIGVVYLDNIGPTANGISQRGAVLGEPAYTNVSLGTTALYSVESDHPIFDGWTIGEHVTLATNNEGEFLSYSSSTEFSNLATVGTGSGMGIDEDRTDILAASMARTDNVSNANFTDDADTILGRAVGYAADRPPDIDITYATLPDEAEINDTVEYTVNITNSGGSTAISALNLLISDTPVAGQVLELGPGGQASVTFPLKVTLDMHPNVWVGAGYAGIQPHSPSAINLNVETPEFDLNVTLQNDTILRGGDTNATVTADFPDGYSTTVNESVEMWSANSSVATVTDPMRVDGVGAGTTRIFAEFFDGWITSIGYTTVTVDEPMKESLSLSTPPTMFVDQTGSPIAHLHYETPVVDNVTTDVTFTSNDSSVLAVNGTTITGIGPGQAELTATLNANQSLNATQTVTVSEPELQSLDVLLGTTALTTPDSTSATVIGTYQAGITRDVTANATILSFDETVASVTDTTVSAKSAGQAEIYAEFDGQFDTSQVTVTEPDVDALVIDVPPRLAINETGSVTVTATDSLGTDTTVTENASITSSNTSVVSVDNGTLEAIGTGNATLEATYGSESATGTVTVTPSMPPTYKVTIPNDGGIHSLGFPAPINGSLAAAFPNGYDGLSNVYEYNGGWSQINDFDNTSVDPLDTIVLNTRGDDGPAEITLELPLETGTAPSSRSVGAGWQYLAAPAFTDVESAFGGSIDASVTAIDRYGTPSSSAFQSVAPFSFYRFGSYQWGVTPPTVSPFKGYFVYFEESATVPVVVSDLESRSDADFKLGVE